MTYKTRYTLRLRHVSHPDTKGHGITGVHACNMHKHTHTHIYTQSVINKPEQYTLVHDHKTQPASLPATDQPPTGLIQ